MCETRSPRSWVLSDGWQSPFHVGDRIADPVGYEGIVVAERRDGKVIWVQWVTAGTFEKWGAPMRIVLADVHPMMPLRLIPDPALGE